MVVVRHREATYEFVKREMDMLAKDLPQIAPQFCMIIHDRDEDSLTGEVMTPHLHINLWTSKRRTGGMVLNFIAECLGCETLGIEIDKIKNEHLSLRYLGHKDNFEKHPYQFNEVYSNCPAMREKVRMHWVNDFVELSSVEIIKLCETCSYNRHEILCALGVTLYQKYRLIINDLINDNGGVK